MIIENKNVMVAGIKPEEINGFFAKFMNFPAPHEEWLVTEYDTEFPYEREGTVKDMRYHDSWDWIMTVVEKIRQDNRCIAFEICFCLSTQVKIWFANKWHFYESNDSKEVVIWACIEYINWFNSLKV